MVFIDFSHGPIIDVIHWGPMTPRYDVSRFEREGHEIKIRRAKLTVPRGSTAVFRHEGQLADVFTPAGFIGLKPNNIADHDIVAGTCGPRL